MINNNAKTTKTIIFINTLLLTACASTSTLDFEIPPNNIKDFNQCMVPVDLEKLEKNTGGDPLFFLKSNTPKPNDFKLNLLSALSESISSILSMHYADKEKLTVPNGIQRLSVPFDMYTQPFPYFDSRMVNVAENIFDTVKLSQLLEPENLVATDFKEEIPGRIAKALKTYLLAYFTTRPNTGGKVGFISRDGTTFKFPVDIDLGSGNATQNPTQAISSVDHSQVGADIIRIILEAIRDGSLKECDALPAVDESATGVKAGLLRFYTDIPNQNCKGQWKVADKDLGGIQARSYAAESMIATAAGKALRGGSIGSLDNEALARAAETAIGVMARHTTERVEWCKAKVQ